jgi:hypothetical protein
MTAQVGQPPEAACSQTDQLYLLFEKQHKITKKKTNKKQTKQKNTYTHTKMKEKCCCYSTDTYVK